MNSTAERPQDAANASASDVSIAPLDRLQVPPELDGSAGTFRYKGHSILDAYTDLDAISQWLRRYEGNPSTYRTYRDVVERLVNWALVERCKALSSLNDSDLIAFEEFLADPQPRWRWISQRATARSALDWTPLVGPLSPRSRLHTLVVLRVMFDWLNNMGYCDVGRSLWRHSIRSPHQPSGLVLSVARHAAPKFVGLDDWQLLRRSLGMDTRNTHRIEVRLAVELMYYGSLNVKEVGNASVHDVTRTDRAMLLHIPSRPSSLATIYLVPPIAMTISSLLDGLGADALDGALAVGLQSREEANGQFPQRRLISARSIGFLVKGAFRRAAKLAESEGNMAAAIRLAAHTSHSLRHSFEIHAQEYDDANWIWLLIGAARLIAGTTRQYMQRKELTDDEIENAYRSLAPCWNIAGIP